MRRLIGPALILLLLIGCGSPFTSTSSDSPPPTPLSVPLAANLATPPTAPRGTPDVGATATRAVASSTAVIGSTPGTPLPVRPGPPATPNSGGTPRAGTPTVNPVATPGTTIQLFAPYRPGGLAGGLRVEADVQGYCSVDSEMLPGRPDAWHCTANNRIYDPCFAAESTDTMPLACAADPWAGSVTLLTLTAPLPRDRANAVGGTMHNPWGLQLANGVRCQVLIGARAMIVGMRIGAACSDGSQIVGDPDRSTGRWRVYILRDDEPTLATEEVVTVWY